MKAVQKLTAKSVYETMVNDVGRFDRKRRWYSAHELCWRLGRPIVPDEIHVMLLLLALLENEGVVMRWRGWLGDEMWGLTDWSSERP